MKTNEVILYMKSHPYWEEFEKHLLEHRPVVPDYDPENDNSLLWKHRSGQQQGFDIIVNLLKIEVKK